VNLREWAKGKKLVLVVYLAPWCNNWKLEAPVVDRLYAKYKAHGFDVVGVSNYGTERDQQVYFKDKNLPYTVVVESDTREARDKTTHYSYRQLTGDARKWGSPYNIFLVPSKLKHDGDVLTEKAWVNNGELIEEEADEFIRKRLGLKEEKKDKEKKEEKKSDEKTATQS
jgi:thiol-disulfide isomerase/thioredoxin